MTPFAWCLLSTLAGGVLSVSVAALSAAAMGAATLSRLVSYATGALLAAAFLDVLPEAIHESGDAQATTTLMLVGILVFFALEKIVIWRHDHAGASSLAAPMHGHDPAMGRSHHRGALMVTIGDSFHNFVDGVLVAAAFQQDIQLGMVTAAAIVAHEIPQELGDVVVLLHSGWSRRRALAFNLLSSLAMTLGALLAWLTLPLLDGAIPVCLVLACASMVYVAMADLIPCLHRQASLSATLQQLLLIGAGMASVVGAHQLADWLAIH
jgi:zinc and cadmium transporter